MAEEIKSNEGVDNKKNHRLNLAVSEEIRLALDSLQQQTGCRSMAQVVHYAISLLSFVVSSLKSGHKIYVEAGDERKEMVFPFIVNKFSK